MLLKIYKIATYLAQPLIYLYLYKRLRAGKEDRLRIGERFGNSSLPRPAGKLIWIHAASVGESVSILPLIREMGRMKPECKVLVTTGTVSSGRVMGERLPAHAFHQFVPVDTPSAVRAFLDASL